MTQVTANKPLKNISESDIQTLLKKLELSSSPGIDGVTAEHLIYGNCNILRRHLSVLCSHIFNFTTVPAVLQTGVIVPILKKPTLNPNDPANFRPITVCSIYSKLIELLIDIQDTASDTQYGFREKRGTDLCSVLLNDVISYFKFGKTPLFICSLDAERCFDKIWHDGLFYKLWGILHPTDWLLLYTWYRNLYAVVKWRRIYSKSFHMTRGTRQGSILSPKFFNVFINDLLIQLGGSNYGIRLGRHKINHFAYADDITLISSTAPGLQALIDICYGYAQNWSFTYGLNKSKCLVTGNTQIFTPGKISSQFSWTLGDNQIETVEELNILCITYSNKGTYSSHVNARCSAARRAIYRLSSVGLSYPGVHSHVKSYLWKSIGIPSLSYGMDCISLRKSDWSLLESTQGTIVKNLLGFGKRHHHSRLLKVMKIPNIVEVVKQDITSLAFRISRVESPTRSVLFYLLSKYFSHNVVIDGTLPFRLIDKGIPFSCVFSKLKSSATPAYTDSGIDDTLCYLLSHPKFNQRGSTEHHLAELLLRPF